MREHRMRQISHVYAFDKSWLKRFLVFVDFTRYFLVYVCGAHFSERTTTNNWTYRADHRIGNERNENVSPCYGLVRKLVRRLFFRFFLLLCVPTWFWVENIFCSDLKRSHGCFGPRLLLWFWLVYGPPAQWF